jgi:hypothetical protein
MAQYGRPPTYAYSAKKFNNSCHMKRSLSKLGVDCTEPSPKVRVPWLSASRIVGLSRKELLPHPSLVLNSQLCKNDTFQNQFFNQTFIQRNLEANAQNERPLVDQSSEI